MCLPHALVLLSVETTRASAWFILTNLIEIDRKSKMHQRGKNVIETLTDLYDPGHPIISRRQIKCLRTGITDKVGAHGSKSEVKMLRPMVVKGRFSRKELFLVAHKRFLFELWWFR